MIRIIKPAVSMSVQDRGRYGHRAEGFTSSGAMDPLSLEAANRAAGAPDGSAGIEFGPGHLVIEAVEKGTIAFGGAPRLGAPWWEPIEVQAGKRIELAGAQEGWWSYLCLAGGVEAPVVLGSRSTTVREGIGSWMKKGDEVGPAGEAAASEFVEPPPLRGPVRIFGGLPGAWKVGSAIDRMGYALEGEPMGPAPAEEWSEPVLPGCVQLLPSGLPVVLMAEAPTVGGYRLAGAVHSEDLRLIAQSPPEAGLEFESVG